MVEEVAVVKKPGGGGDPPHEAVRLHRDLINLMRFIREKYQEKIDQAFDRVSRQIGYVVATTLPVTLEVGKGGKVKRLAVGAKHLENTLFDKQILGAIRPIEDDPIPIDRPGVYDLYVIWFEALKLKLKSNWAGSPGETIMTPVIPLPPPSPQSMEPRPWAEPAHWFEPGYLITLEEQVIINALDEVYPELKLVDRIDFYRRGMERLKLGSGPGPTVLGPNPQPWNVQLVREINEILRRYGLVSATPEPLP